MAGLQKLIRGVVTGRISEAQALQQIADGDGRGRMREADQAVTRYQSDGLTENDSIIQASDAFSHYCGQI
jgi:hypothetical protein